MGSCHCAIVPSTSPTWHSLPHNVNTSKSLSSFQLSSFHLPRPLRALPSLTEHPVGHLHHYVNTACRPMARETGHAALPLFCRSRSPFSPACTAMGSFSRARLGLQPSPAQPSPLIPAAPEAEEPGGWKEEARWGRGEETARVVGGGGRGEAGTNGRPPPIFLPEKNRASLAWGSFQHT